MAEGFDKSCLNTGRSRSVRLGGCRATGMRRITLQQSDVFGVVPRRRETPAPRSRGKGLEWYTLGGEGGREGWCVCVCVSRMALTLRWTALFRASRFTHHVAQLPACPKKSPPDPKLVPSQRIRSGSRPRNGQPGCRGRAIGEEAEGRERRGAVRAAIFTHVLGPHGWRDQRSLGGS